MAGIVLEHLSTSSTRPVSQSVRQQAGRHRAPVVTCQCLVTTPSAARYYTAADTATMTHRRAGEMTSPLKIVRGKKVHDNQKCNGGQCETGIISGIKRKSKMLDWKCGTCNLVPYFPVSHFLQHPQFSALQAPPLPDPSSPFMGSTIQLLGFSVL